MMRTARMTLMSRRPLSFVSVKEEFPSAALPAASLAPASFKQATMDGGVTVLTKDVYSPIVALRFSLLGGSSTETASQKGAAAFLASAAYAGNRKNSGLRIVRFLESLGASFSASADRSAINYELRVLPDRVEPVVAAAVSLLSSPPHAPYVFEEARADAQLRLQKAYECAEFGIHELLREAAFGEGTPLGSPLYGRGADASALAVSDILAYRAAHFTPANLVVSGSGLSQERLQSLLSLHLPRMPAAAGPAPALPPFAFQGGEVRVRDRADGQTCLAVGLPVGAGVAPLVAAEVLAASLSQSLRVKGVCASARVLSHPSGSIFAVTVRGNVEQASSAIRAALGELARAKDQGDFSLARRTLQLQSSLLLERREDTSALLAAHQMQTTPAQLLGHGAVTDQEVRALAASMLRSAPAYAVRGTTAGAPSLAAIQALLK